MARNYSNIAFDTTLSAGIAAGDLSLVVASAAGWPAVPFAAVLDPGSLTIEEVVQVTLVAGTTFTITRGFDGTTAAAHANGATVRHAAIAGDFTDLQAALLNVAYTNVANTFTLGPNRFSAGAAGNVALAARRHSSGATANIFEAQDEGGVAVASINASGVGTFNQAILTDYGIHQPVYNSAIIGYAQIAAIGTFNKAINNPGATTNVLNTALTHVLDIQVAPISSFVAAIGLRMQTVVPATALFNPNLVQSAQFSLDHYSTATNVAPDITAASYTANGRGSSAVTSMTAGNFAVAAVSGATATYTTFVAMNVSASNAGAGLVTNRYGIRINADSSAGPVTNSYQLRIETNTASPAASKYAIWVDGGQTRLKTGAAATIGLVVEGFTSQSANLQEWQDVSANVLSSVSPIGAGLFRPRDAVTAAVTPALTLGHVSSGTPAASFGTRLLFQLNTNGGADRDGAAIDTILTTAADATRTTAVVIYTVNSAAALAETLRIAPVQVTVTGHVSSNTTNTHNLGSSGARWKDSWFAGAMTGRTATMAAAAVGDITLIARGFAAQTGNLQEWQSSASAVYGTISENGYFTTRKIAAPADAELAASELAIWFDATDGAGKLMIKAKTVDGTVVTGNVALV